ncbi:MAG: glutathione S-transferase family protein [Deltaproteobacteria bacterium]|nr:glutathione S-transferase family protein [Deltaproteobacteria bacterium]MBI3386853.1 glutathione S-transferase family protein [Deltaproteobacteria bacterium]
MANTHRIFGNELSPYSVKVRSYFRYKQIPHEWILRNSTNEAEFSQYAKLPLIPLVVTPDAQGVQDSTPIIEHFEKLFPLPSIHPSDPALAFISALIEEYGDEWGNKSMFHYRWWYEPDQQSSGERIARSMMPGISDDVLPGAIEMVKGRMIPRLKFVGSSAETKDIIEGSFKRQLAILDKHLARRKYLFGARPAFGDFGLYAQLYECSTDPTPGAIIRTSAGNVLAWINRMLDPKNEGEFESWPALKPTLMPLLRDEIGAIFFPWSQANAKAIAAGENEFSLTLAGTPYAQEAQKYHAKSLAALRARYAAVSDKSALDPILREANCYLALSVQP